MIRISGIKIPIEIYNKKTLNHQITKQIRCKEESIKSVRINKQSIDARKKPNIYYIIEVDIETSKEKEILNNNKRNKNIKATPKEEYIYPQKGLQTLNKRPIIIGSGPSGLFCAYILAEMGYNPIIIERGEKIENRVKSVENFWKTGLLNSNSNVQFGEGGAGAFSRFRGI